MCTRLLLFFILAFTQSYAQENYGVDETFKITMVQEVERLLKSCDLQSYNSSSEFRKTYNNVIYNKCEIGDDHFVRPYEVITKIESKEAGLFKQDIFYTYKNELLYARETELYTFEESRDTIKWNCEYFFKEGKLVDYHSLGHGKTENENWNPETISIKYLNYKREFDD